MPRLLERVVLTRLPALAVRAKALGNSPFKFLGFYAGESRLMATARGPAGSPRLVPAYIKFGQGACPRAPRCRGQTNWRWQAARHAKTSGRVFRSNSAKERRCRERVGVLAGQVLYFSRECQANLVGRRLRSIGAGGAPR